MLLLAGAAVGRGRAVTVSTGCASGEAVHVVRCGWTGRSSLRGSCCMLLPAAGGAGLWSTREWAVDVAVFAA